MVRLLRKRDKKQLRGPRLLAETSVEAVIAEATAVNAKVAVIDSIQTMHTENVDSSPGSASVRRTRGRQDVSMGDTSQPDSTTSLVWPTRCRVSRR